MPTITGVQDAHPDGMRKLDRRSILERCLVEA
jgi:hypothetical protein